MGRIKSTLIKRSAEKLADAELPFTQEFHNNKQILGRNLPSKKLRNKVAGYIVRLKVEEKKKAQILQESKN